MKRIFLFVCFLPCFVRAEHYWVREWWVHSNDGSVLGMRIRCQTCGAGGNTVLPNVGNGWCNCHSPSISILYRSMSLFVTNPDNNQQEQGRANLINGQILEYMDSIPANAVPAIDWDAMSDPNNYGLKLASLGSGYVDSAGNVYLAIVDSPDGLSSDIPRIYYNPATSIGNGQYQAESYNDAGKLGTFTVTSLGDGLFSAPVFKTYWSGGVSGSSSSSSLPSSGGATFVNTSTSSPVTFGGSSSQMYFNSPSTTTISDGGTSFNVVNYPVNNYVTSSGDTIPIIDYRDGLNAIGGTLQGGFDDVHTAFETLVENQKSQLELDSADGLDVAEPDEPQDDTSSVDSEVADVLQEVSGWGFDFGMGSNPLGQIFTSLFGNPPTSFGSQDVIWDTEIPITSDLSVTSRFALSDYFIPAFRSCILMILSLVFAIATAKSVSGAFI